MLPDSRFDSYSLAECWYEGSKARYLVICLADNNPQVTHGETVGPGCLPVKECAESHSEAIIRPSVGSRKYESDLKSDALNGLGVRGPSWAVARFSTSTWCAMGNANEMQFLLSNDKKQP